MKLRKQSRLGVCERLAGGVFVEADGNHTLLSSYVVDNLWQTATVKQVCLSPTVGCGLCIAGFRASGRAFGIHIGALAMRIGLRGMI